MKALTTLTDGLVNQLRDIYSAENQLLKALPKMEKKATNPKLKEGFRAHLVETEGQVERLETIGKMLDEKLSGHPCKAMQGLLEEGKEVLEEESENKALIDALLIGAARRVEHYEIAAYCTARTMASELGLDEVSELLGETFDEEMACDSTLSSLLTDEVAVEANRSPESETEEDTEERTKPSSSNKRSPSSPKKSGNVARVMGVVGCLLIGHSVSSSAHADTTTNRANAEQQATKYENDNTGRNVRDLNENRLTASDQKMGGPELDVLAVIRRQIVDNDNLSVNAKNVKIVVEGRKIMLRGPVKTAEEKRWIGTTTARVAPSHTVVNELEVTQG